MKLEKKDALWLVLSVVLSIFIIGVFVSQALSWAFADDATVEDMGYDAYANTYWSNDTHGDIFFKTSEPIKCLYYQPDNGITMYSLTENSFIGAYWYSGSGLTQYNESTAGTGAFTLGQDGFYQFFARDRQLTPSSNYPIFDDAGYALQYLNGDDSVLQYAINFDDLPLNSDDLLQEYIENLYFSFVGSSSAQFQIELSADCPEGLELEVIPSSIAYVYGESDGLGLSNNMSRYSSCPEFLYNISTQDKAYFDVSVNEYKYVYSVASFGDIDTYPLTSKESRSTFPFFPIYDSIIEGGTNKSVVGGLYYKNYNLDNYITSPSSTFSGIVNMDLDSNISIPYMLGKNFVTSGCSPLAFQVCCRIIDRSSGGLASASPYVYVTATCDGSISKGGLFGKTVGGTQNITRKDSNGLSNISTTNTSGVVGFENGSIDNSNIIPYIESGMGLTGDNGLILMFQNVLSFLPKEVWAMIFFALGLSIVLMIVKIMRGM